MPTEEDTLKAADERTNAFAALLTDYLKERFNYKRPSVRLGISSCSVVAQTAQYDLYFRVTPPDMRDWNSNTLVVARLGFREQRQGHGRDLLRFIVDLASKLPFTHIGIEQANPNAVAFGAKFGFAQYGTGKDLLAPVEEVRKNLE
ncbi:hypothetical protein V0R48_09780 [Pseudomonas alcaligenes]|uniref:hypothetical protein n=1 Tax=Aquipseudomonas alcaligenes TaxID=43263 RepID=UPI002E7B1751|nr:hypothetical protein [Pseudomonas alcaligenes]MEE1949263.1 hypothetical protein [Pseudomonas alcaligenes]